MSEESAESRLALLEQRIARIERELGVASLGPLPTRAEGPVRVPPPAQVVLTETAPVPAPLAGGEAPFVWRAGHERAAFKGVQARHRAARRGALESAIGLKWTGWVGAIVLVIGVALAVQFAYEHKWFDRVPPSIRLATIFAAGFVLLGAGECVLRMIHRVPAASLFGAGVATLFVGAYAGYSYFELYSQSTSMALMALSSLVGALVAVRGKMVSIGALSVLGASVAPRLVANDKAPVIPLLFYLLAVQGVALFLSSWGRSARWWGLRSLSLICNACWMAAVLESRHGGEQVVLIFMIAFAVLYHGEVLLTTVRRGGSGGDTAENAAARTVGVAFVLCVTAALTLGVLTFYADAAKSIRSEWVIGLAAVSTVLGLGCVRVSEALRGLGMAHRAAAAALLVLAVPVATGGVRVEVGWMLLSVAFAVAFGVTGSRIASLAAPLTWMGGLIHLGSRVGDLSRDMSVQGGVGNVWLVIKGTQIGSNVILAWLFVIAGHVIALLLIQRRTEEHYEERLMGARCVGYVCWAVWLAACIGGLPTLGATTMIIAYLWLLVAGGMAEGRLHMAPLALAALAIATAKWGTVDVVIHRLASEWAAESPVMNLLAGVSLLLAISWVALYVIRVMSAADDSPGAKAGEGDERLRWQTLVVVALMVLLESGAMETDRAFCQASVRGGFSDPELAEQVALSIYGAVFAVVTLAVGFGCRLRAVRYFSLVLLGGTLLKVAVVDLSEVTYGYRIVSLVGVGVLMLGTSVLYGKMSPVLLGRGEAKAG